MIFIIIQALILGVIGYVLYKFCFRDDDHDDHVIRIDQPAAPVAPPRPQPVLAGINYQLLFGLSNNNRTPGNYNYNRDNQQNATESAEQLQLRRTVLRRFKCPFEEEDACRFKQNPQQCIFTHVGPNGTADDDALKEVPAYACIYHLINSCRSVRNAPNPAIQNQPNSIQNILPCINGIHLSVVEIADLDRYERANRLTIRRFFGRDAERQCGVCLETVLSKRLSRTRRFAILENCVHAFCVQCIVEWRSRSGNHGCPLCTIVSHRVVYRRRFTDKPEYKRNLFRYGQIHSYS